MIEAPVMVQDRGSGDLNPVSGREFQGLAIAVPTSTFNRERNMLMPRPVKGHPVRCLMKRLTLLACAAFSLTGAVRAEPLAGYDRFDLASTHRSAPIAASLWYPVGTPTYRGLIGDNPVFQGTYAYVGAAMAPGRHPLVLLSHGSGGNMDGLGWLSSRLALKGAIVLAVNHQGSTSGDSSPRRSVRLSERADDLKEALDHVLADPQISARIYPDRIVTLGFSLGGATALDLAGARNDKALYKTYCERFPDAADCAFFRKGGVDTANMPDAFVGDMRDRRVRAAIAIDPGMTWAMTPESVRAMDLPVLLINLGGESLWKAIDVSAGGSGLAENLPKAEYSRIGPASHFTFLGLCKPDGARLLAEEQDDPVCTDPEGADRTKVHEAVAERIVRFLGL